MRPARTEGRRDLSNDHNSEPFPIPQVRCIRNGWEKTPVPFEMLADDVRPSAGLVIGLVKKERSRPRR
jgi:hypothetical protein